MTQAPVWQSRLTDDVLQTKFAPLPATHVLPTHVLPTHVLPTHALLMPQVCGDPDSRLEVTTNRRRAATKSVAASGESADNAYAAYASLPGTHALPATDSGAHNDSIAFAASDA